MMSKSGCHMARSLSVPRGAGVIVAILLMSTVAVMHDGGSDPGTLTARALASFTGTLNITVTDDAGRMMVGANVKIAGNDTTPVTTGPKGFVLISGLYAEESGTSYFVWAAKQYYGNSTAQTVEVHANATTNATLMIRGSTILGQVVDSTGSPIAGANVSIADVDYPDYNLTGADGMYQLLGVPSGLKPVTAASSGYYAKTTLVNVPLNKSAFVNFVLTSLTGNVSGYVLSLPDLNGIFGATVSITVFPLVITIKTNNTGYYRFENLTAGTYSVSASMEGYSSSTKSEVTVVQGEETSNVNFTLEEKATRLYGVVKAGNVLKSMANVTIVGAGLWTLSAFNGSYSIVDITAGIYNVTASLPGYYTTTIVDVPIPRGDEKKLDIELVPLPGGVLQGYVLESDSKKPIATVNVTLIGPNSETYSGQTDPNGAFQIPALDPGNYTIQLEREGYRPLEVRNIVVTPEHATTRNFTMEPIREGFQGFFFGFDLAHSMMILALFLTMVIFGIAVYLRMRSFQTPQNAPAVYDEAEEKPEVKEGGEPPKDQAEKASDDNRNKSKKVLKRSKE